METLKESKRKNIQFNFYELSNEISVEMVSKKTNKSVLIPHIPKKFLQPLLDCFADAPDFDFSAVKDSQFYDIVQKILFLTLELDLESSSERELRLKLSLIKKMLWDLIKFNC